jgi:3-hydroxyacyl-[acyl-carrier-protein] dehydratase
MKLLDTFCKMNAFVVDGSVIRAELVFPETHPVYGGHFPGRPVVPGACVLQIVTELFEHALGHPLHLVEAGNIKFPAALLPSDTEPVTVEITHKLSETGWLATATVRSADRLNVSLRDLTYESSEYAPPVDQGSL